MGEITSIKLENVTFRYGLSKNNIFQNLTFSMEPNQITGLVGRNAQGKTTLMKLMSGQLNVDDGSVLINGKSPVTDIEVAEDILYSASVMPYEKGRKMRKIISDYELMYKNFDADFAQKILKIFCIDIDKNVLKLSKGQVSIFNFACAIATRAGFTILDEPVSGVDAVGRKRIYEIILRDYMEYPRTILISSHVLGEMEKLLSQIIMIGGQKVLFNGDIEEMKQMAFKVKGDAERLAEFVKDKNVLYKKLSEIDSMAVVEEEYSEVLKAEANRLNLSISKITAEEYYIYRTSNYAGEDLEELWEK